MRGPFFVGVVVWALLPASLLVRNQDPLARFGLDVVLGSNLTFTAMQYRRALGQFPPA